MVKNPQDDKTAAVGNGGEEGAFDVHEAVRRVRLAVLQHIPMIVVTCAVTLGLAITYVKVFPPIFKAEAMVAGEATEDASRSSYYASWNVFRKSDLKSEPALMTSRSVARQVVEDLDLKFDDVHHSILMHIGYLWTESWVGKKYRAFKAWLFPPDPAEYQPTPAEIDRARTIEAFKESLVLEPVGNSTVARLMVKAPTYRAAEFVNKALDVYLSERRRVGSQEAEGAYQTLKGEIEKVQISLLEVEQEKLEFDRKNNLSVEFERDKVLLGKWGELRSLIQEQEAQVASIQASLAVVDQNLAEEPAEIVNGRTFQESRVRGMLETREFELRSALKGLEEKYRPDSPEVLEGRRLLADTIIALENQPQRNEISQTKILNPTHQALKSQKQALQTRLASIGATLTKNRADFNILSQRLDALPAIFAQAHVIARKREQIEGRFKLLNERFMMADVSRFAAMSAPSSLRVVDYAAPPMKRSWPDLKLLLPAALAVGLLFGVGLAILAEMFSARVTRNRLAGRRELPIYAIVGLHGETSGKIKLGGAGDSARSALGRLRPDSEGTRDRRFFTKRMNEAATRRLQLENDLYRAVERGELALHYQPWVSLADDSLSGREALLRWNHPQRGQVPPGEFITIADDTGLIVPVGEWALATAVAQMKAWVDAGVGPRTVAVNLSARQFRQHDLVERVRGVLEAAGLPAKYLEVDISELTLRKETDQIVGTLEALDALGVRLSIDDVGARYGALAYLQRFPVHQIKINQAYVRDMLADAANAKIVRSIVAFSHDLNISVVAKGVETAAEVDFLRECKCDEAQGYFFGRPVPAEEIESTQRSKG
jgi:EAL domain-containing protein (putative c-di-GMP-specific phosphodiesterase class I)/uncharacterized protein involved in exopolysaccharide biosynthesis